MTDLGEPGTLQPPGSGRKDCVDVIIAESYPTTSSAGSCGYLHGCDEFFGVWQELFMSRGSLG